MSDYFISYMPVEPNYIPSKNIAKQLSELEIHGCTTVLEIEDILKFADAGANFESVRCPYCDADIIKWWGGAMGNAYDMDEGFTDLEICTPCCGAKSTLNDLNYHFPQGFYRTRLFAEPFVDAQIDTNSICVKLETITGMKWRAIHQHL